MTAGWLFYRNGRDRLELPGIIVGLKGGYDLSWKKHSNFCATPWTSIIKILQGDLERQAFVKRIA
jgi:hypothetical protein